MQSCANLDVRYCQGLSGLESIRAEWQLLYDRCRSKAFYNDWRWHRAVQKHLIPGDVCYVYASLNQEPVAILPLVAETIRKGPFPVRQLAFPGHPAIDLADMLVADDFDQIKVFDRILAALRKRPPHPWDMLELGQFVDNSCLDRQLRLHQLPTVPGGYSASVSGSSATDLLGQLSKKQVKNVRRHLRNAEDSYGQCSLVGAEGHDAVGRQYEAFLRVEASGWKGSDGTGSAIVLRADAKAFYQDVLNSFGETGQALVNVMHFGAEPVAGQIGLRTPGRLSLLKIGYDEKYRDVGPGAIALLKTIESAPAQPFEISLVTCPPWSERWHFPRTTKHVFQTFNSTAYGRFLALAAKGARRFRQSDRSNDNSR